MAVHCYPHSTNTILLKHLQQERKNGKSPGGWDQKSRCCVFLPQWALQWQPASTVVWAKPAQVGHWERPRVETKLINKQGKGDYQTSSNFLSLQGRARESRLTLGTLLLLLLAAARNWKWGKSGEKKAPVSFVYSISESQKPTHLGSSSGASSGSGEVLALYGHVCPPPSANTRSLRLVLLKCSLGSGSLLWPSSCSPISQAKKGQRNVAGLPWTAAAISHQWLLLLALWDVQFASRGCINLVLHLHSLTLQTVGLHTRKSREAWEYKAKYGLPWTLSPSTNQSAVAVLLQWNCNSMIPARQECSIHI